MKTLISILAVILPFTSVIAQEGKPTAPAPASVAGSWKVKGTGAIWVIADNKLTVTSGGGGTATLKPIPDTSKYDVTWGNGGAYTLVIDPLNKDLISLINGAGKAVEAERIPVKLDMIVGKWRHSGYVLWTFKADGTVHCSDSGLDGTWKYAERERKYTIVWKDGAVISTGVVDHNGRIKFEHSTGSKFLLVPVTAE